MCNQWLFGRTRLWLAAVVLITCQPFHTAWADTGPLKPSHPPLENARLDAVDQDSTTFAVTDCAQPASESSPRLTNCQGPAFSIQVHDPALKAKLKQLRVGDHIRINFDAQNVLTEINGLWSVPVSFQLRLMVIGGCALMFLAFAALASKGAPLKFIVGEDNRYSNSKFQLALWSWVVLTTYTACLCLRLSEAGWDFLGNISIPQNLLLLSGLSALTYGGAKGITTAKANAAMSAAVPDPKHSLAPGQERLLRDLTQDDKGGFDLGDFQMLIITLLASVSYMVLVFHFLGDIAFAKTVSLPDVDSTILAVFGIGQGAYLTKKAVGNISES